MKRAISVVLVVGSSFGVLQGCGYIIGAGVGAAASNIDPKAPKAETAANCKSWECFDGYACGPCEEAVEDDKAKVKPKK